MALQTIRGHVVLESAGPVWHLVGVVTRDKVQPNQLTFSRQRDALSSKLTGLGTRFLASLRLTDLSGKSVVLTNARIVGLELQKGAAAGKTQHSSSQSTYEQDQISFCFQQIVVESLFGTSASDDWT